MTDRQLFMEKLRTALMVRGVQGEDAAFYLNDRFYDILARESAENIALDRVDLMADRIAEHIRERAASAKDESAASVIVDPTEESTEYQPVAELNEPTEVFGTDNSQESKMLVVPPLSDTEPVSSDRTVTISSVGDELFDDTVEEPTAEINIVPHDTAEEALIERTQTVDTVQDEAAAEVPLSEYDEEYSDYSYSDGRYGYTEQNEMPDYTEEPLDEVDLDGDFDEIAAAPDDMPQNRLPDYIEEKPIPNSKLFWVLFGVTSPLWIALLAVGFAIFAAVWIALGALIGALIAVMITVIAVGSAAALVGIIYGIIEVAAPATLSVGVYNIGLGIISAGVAMLLGIVTYNLALRLMPWLIKLVGRFFRFTLKQLKKLFNHLRRECAKQ